MIVVANTIPHPKDTAIGIRNADCVLGSNIKGSKPKKVVSDVSKIGRKRRTPARRTASINFMPFLTWRFMKSTITRLSFTTTPDKAIIPSNESIDTAEVGLLPLPRTSSKRKFIII